MAAILFLVALVVAFATACYRGSRLDRVTASVLVAASLLSIAAERAIPGTFARPELGVAAVDLALLLFLLWVLKRSDKFWPIWAVGFHSISVVTHLAVMVAPEYLSTPYALYASWWSLPVVLVFLAGCFEIPGTAERTFIQS